ncbi:MAG TPA: DUF1592 domain-containing protein [Polyangia bacterium]|nr:DUF1592 domain-containing protein [Polyangia bacterium]
MALAIGCSPGTISDGGPGNGGAGGSGPGVTPPGGKPTTMDPPPGSPSVGSMRRLSTAQYQRALTDLLGPIGALGEIEESASSANLRSIGAAITALSPRNVEQYETAANTALEGVFADAKRRDALIGCAPAAWDETCARNFVQTFGRRAWRRALNADEITRYVKMAQDEATAPGTFADGILAIASALLQSPNFLYRLELGGAPLPGKTFGRYTPYETATRLSFLLWSAIPDAQLLAAAEAGRLDTPDAIGKEAQRLLDSPRLLDGLNDMVDDMLSLDSVYLMAKDTKIFPQLTPTIRPAMRAEILKLFEDVVIKRNGDVMELYDTTKTFVNAELGKLYGITVTGTDLVESQHPTSIPRAGILTSAALLTVQDKLYQTSPTRRGAFVRRNITCEHIPDPPPGVDTNIPEPPPGVVQSRRQRLAGHATNPTCGGCHTLMDSIGLAFENFDAMGMYRTKEENGLPIDPSGELDGKKFSGPRELGALIRQSDTARDCMARRIYRFANAREENNYDEAQIAQITKAFVASGQKVRSMLATLVQSDGFLNVSPPVRK